MEENGELLENSMVLQEVPQHNFEAELEYKEKTEEAYFDEELLQQLEEIRDTAQMNLAVREGYKDYEVINVINYNKDVELIAIETEEIEYLDLDVVIAEDMETGEISRKIERGKHTTRHTQLIALGGNSYIMDTPGFSSLFLFDMEKEQLQSFYPEFAEYEKNCQFSGCSHIGEPVCGVKEALADGRISSVRYENYKILYEELKSKKKY